MKRKRKIHGTFCEKTAAPAARFDRRSLRWVKKGRDWLLVGCPRGHYGAGHCKVGTRAHKILAPSHGPCPRGQRRVRKEAR